MEMGTRRVQRAVLESNYVNTINLADRITIEFVWYPGERHVKTSLIDVIMHVPKAGAAPREVSYKWSRKGMANIERTLVDGRVTLPLPPGGSGVLRIFDTDWRITRAKLGVTMSNPNSLRGVQQRLNRLGYHLRKPGASSAGSDGKNNSITELAILSFQGDAGFRVRGEWIANPDIQENLNAYNDIEPGRPDAPNSSAEDGAKLQLALVRAVRM